MDLLQALMLVLQCQHVYDLVFIANLPGTQQGVFQRLSVMLGNAFATTADTSLRALMSLRPGLLRDDAYAVRAMDYVKLDGLILAAISRFDAVNEIFKIRFGRDWQVAQLKLLEAREGYAAYVRLLEELVEKLDAAGFHPGSGDAGQQTARPFQPFNELGARSDPLIQSQFGVTRSEVMALLETMKRGRDAIFLIRGLLIDQERSVSSALADVPKWQSDPPASIGGVQDQEVRRITELMEFLDQFLAEAQPIIEPFCIELGVPGLAEAVRAVSIPAQSSRPRPGRSLGEDPLKWLLHIQAALIALLQEHSKLTTVSLLPGGDRAVAAMSATIAGSAQGTGAIGRCQQLFHGSALLRADLGRVCPSRRAAETSACGELLWRAYEVQAALITCAAILTTELVCAEWLICQCTIQEGDQDKVINDGTWDHWVPQLMLFLASNLESVANQLRSETSPPPISLFRVPNLQDPELIAIYTRKVRQEGLAFAAIYHQIQIARRIANDLIQLLNAGAQTSLKAEEAGPINGLLEFAEQSIDAVIATLNTIALELARLLREQGYEDLALVASSLIANN
jgi:hypothetical protein